MIYDDNRLPDIASDLDDAILCNITTLWLIQPTALAARTLDRHPVAATSSSLPIGHSAAASSSDGTRDEVDRPHGSHVTLVSGESSGPTSSNMTAEPKSKRHRPGET